MRFKFLPIGLVCLPVFLQAVSFPSPIHPAATQLHLTNTHIKSSNLFWLAEIQNLHSTHSDNFRGGGFAAGKEVAEGLYLGLGMEYAYDGYHGDNGWNLRRLKFLPVYLDARWYQHEENKFSTYAHVCSGLTFARYDKDRQHPGSRQYHVRERGLYLYGGYGVRYRISKQVSTLFELGMKGYHMSFNDLDVNPHGVTARIGVIL
jgi:hypothetical protein